MADLIYLFIYLGVIVAIATAFITWLGFNKTREITRAGEKQIKVEIQKSPVPIVWLDTSIIANIAQWKFEIGNPLEKTTIRRVQRLYDQIYESTRAGRLICPQSEQANEVWIAREMWMKIMNELSMSIKTAASQTIHDNQIRHFMTAYIKKEKTIRLKFQEAFLSDPVTELEKRLRSPFFVCVDSGIIGGHERYKNVKRNVHKEQEELRKNIVKREATFEEQLETEFLGEIQTLISMSKKLLSNACDSKDEGSNAYWLFNSLSRQMQWWENFGGSPKGIEGLIQFHKSSYYRTMPYTNLCCRLTAHIMTKKQPIKQGDSTDIAHISTVMPYADLFITDKAMRNIIKQQKLDLLYKTKVCYVGDTDIIDDFFSKL